ncbi:MAG TPA: family 78 glycoside hydrolase catalytic domain [Dongiaceae bacterium]|nr:family 78 glycoside hydrolase catalytic domain [Dongiaceae bacterium]
MFWVGTIGGSALAAVPVVTTNTVPVTAVDVVGSTVRFVAGFNSDSPVTYQWRKDTGSGPVNIPGATNVALTLSNLQLNDAATPGYSLLASNTTGTTASTARALTVNPVPSAEGNFLTAQAAQTGMGSSGTNFIPTWDVTPGSLIHGLTPSAVGTGDFSQYGAGGVAVLTDGSIGQFNYIPNVGGSSTEVTCGTSGGKSVTYTLPANPSGYDLTNIVVYGGWGDGGRDQQAYTIYYSTVAAPATFVALKSVSFNPSDPAGAQSATRVTLSPASLTPLVRNVAAVRFDFTSPAPENGYCGYSEIDLYGKSTGQPPVANLPVASVPSPVSAGTTVTLSETANGQPPFQYQWQSDSGSGGAYYNDLPDATNSSYALDTTDYGNFAIHYRVQVADQNGVAFSPALLVTVTNSSSTNSAMTVGNLRCEHLTDPLGLDVRQPRLSWQLQATHRGVRQIAYQILVASSSDKLALEQGDLWDSGTIVSDDSVLVSYRGTALTSGEHCYWKVRVWDENANVSAWSPVGMWSLGLLNPSDWTAQWIGMPTNTGISPAPPSPMLRKAFTVSKPVARATAYICGLGYYELQLNGNKVGDHVLDPTWTRYDYQADYVTYDVTTNLAQGANALGVQLANAFYNQWSSDAWNTSTAPWRALPQLLLQLDIEYTDGTHDVVVSDPTWKTATGPLRLDATRLGEVYDARLEKPGWSTAAYSDSSWSNAIVREGVAGPLIAPDAEPITVARTVHPVRIIPVTGSPGVYTFDFGENLVGWGQLNVTGAAGTTVKMIYGEKTNSNGSVDQGNINVYVSQKQYFQTDTYTLKGGGPETWEPRFTYHGFQYAQVSGLPAAPTTNTLVARVVHTAFDPAGSFLCSSDLLNRIETNTLRSYLGNFVGIPTDCPHREKNGWTGDAQLACEIGLTHFHSAAAYTRWLREFRPAQQSNGLLSGIFPNAVWGYGEGPAWESAYLLIPWFVYQHCGDEGILTNNYAGMKAYVDYCTSVASGNIVSYGLGDWEPAGTVTPTEVTDTGYYYQDALILAHTAALMGNAAEAQQYRDLAAQIKTSFNNAFYDADTGRYSGGAQTAQSCALYEGLVSSNQIPTAARELAASVAQTGNTIDTGILGSKFILRALCDNGHADTALALALQTNYPSWGNQIVKGATTLWETWSGAGSQDSLNHVMFGDISAWFMEYLAGIRPGAPGYKTILIKPEMVNGLDWAQGTHDSPYGVITTAWQLSGQQAQLNVTIPPGTTGKIYLPTMGNSGTNLVVRESGNVIWQNGTTSGADSGVQFDHVEGTAPQTYSVWTVTSGSYVFSWNVFPYPNGLAATSGNQWVGLNWNEVPGAIGYNVKRASSSNGNFTTLVGGLNVTHYNDAPLSNGVTWYYVVSAIFPGQESADSAAVSATPEAIRNPGFETPQIGSYIYTPSGAGWTFTGGTDNGSGITANNSGFTSGNPAAPEGNQVGFVQAYGSISQTLSGFVPGTKYTITYAAAQRGGGNQHGGESWNVTLDGTIIAANNPGASATSYSTYTAQFTATAANHTLAFVGTDLVGGDNTVFLDRVQISPALSVVPPTVTLTSPADGITLATPAAISLAANVASQGNVINAVQFYARTNTLIATVTNAPYSYAWTNVAAGAYEIFARTIFNGGNVADSASANVVVTNVPPPLVAIQPVTANGSFVISGSALPGQELVLLTTTNLQPPVIWIPAASNAADGGGTFAFTNLTATNLQQFFQITAP